MKISTRSRYGLRLLVDLAIQRDRKTVFLHEIAKRQGISEKYLSKLVIPLRGAGLIQSERGAHGGYTLAKSPEKINLFEVIKCLEGGVNLLDCTETASSCARSGDCSSRTVWLGLEKAMRDYCEGVSIADLIVSEGSVPYGEYI